MCYDFNQESEVIKLENKTKVKGFNLLEETSESSITDWLKTREEKASEFVRRVADILGEYYTKKHKN